MNKKTKIPLNEVIPLGHEKYDVSELNYRHKICFFKEKNCIVIKANHLLMKIDGPLHEMGEFEELSKQDAALRFPEKFIDSSLGEQYDEHKKYTAAVQLNASEMLFCRKHGAVATYIRDLIRVEMEKENFNADGLHSTI